jgi:hypothetical protein
MITNPEQFTSVHSIPDITSSGWINAKVREGKPFFISLTPSIKRAWVCAEQHLPECGGRAENLGDE